MNDKKFTDEEIVKALRCCVEVRNCGECPVKDEPVSECLIITCTNAANIIEHQKAEIEELKKYVSVSRDAYISIQDKYGYAKAEAYKEFADRAAIALTAAYRPDYAFWILITLDNLLKEMVGEEE